MTVHWVYPTGPQIRTPETIGRNVALRLRARGYDVVQHGWDEIKTITPREGDVLLGHPHYVWGTVFRASAAQAGWRRVIALSPFSHGMVQHNAWMDGQIRRWDLYLAITGRYWFDRVGESPFRHWRPKMVHLDLAVDRADFPLVKTAFNPPGRRRIVYIGNSGRWKNISYLAEIARRVKGGEIGWAGGGKNRIPGLRPLGWLDFAKDSDRRAVAEYDFMITVGRSDANPTTLLEAAAWGLVPVCTRESGYAGEPGFVNVPLDDVEGVLRVLDELQHADEARLRALQAANLRRLDEHFTWERFVGQVVDAIESSASPALEPEPLVRRLSLALTALTSVHSPVSPTALNRIRLSRRVRRKAVRDRGVGADPA